MEILLLRLLPRPLAITADEELPHAKNYYADDTDIAWVAAVQRIPWSPVVFVDDEISTFLYVDEHDVWTPLRSSVPWCPVVFRDDEISSFLYVDEPEIAWNAQVQTVRWNPAIFSDDEAFVAVVTIPVEDYDAWWPQYVLVLWNRLVFTDDEIGAQLRNFYLEDTEAWVGQWAQLPWRPVSWTPGVWADEDAIESAPLPPVVAEKNVATWMRRERILGVRQPT